jgi:hypothetical protein
MLPEDMRAHLPECQWSVHPAQGDWTKQVMSTYVATDFISMIIVPRASMPTSTIVHHLTTVLLMLFVMTSEISSSRTMQLMMMYGFFSTLAWIVNLFLALRVVVPKSPVVTTIAHLASMVYVAVCACNWSLQFIALAAHVLSLDGFTPEIGLFLWGVSMIPLVHDDIILIKWLYAFDPKVEEKKSQLREEINALAKQLAAPKPWESLNSKERKTFRSDAKAQLRSR